MRVRGGNGLGPFLGVLVLATVSVFFFFTYARQAAQKAMFRPAPASYLKDESVREIDSRDGTPIAVFWEGGSAEGLTVLYCCGRDEDIGRAMPRLQSYRLKGFNVACFDYRGFGYSAGRATERNACDDAKSVYDFVVREKGVPESKIVVHGRSVGGGVALELATRRSPGGLILESTFRSVYRSMLSLNWIPGDSFENEKKAPRVNVPVLLIHGEADEVIDVSHCEALRSAFGPGKEPLVYRVPEAGHENVMEVGGAAYWASIEGFIRSLK